MVYSIRYSSRQDSWIPLRLVYIGFQHGMELSNYPNGAGFCMWYYCTEGQGVSEENEPFEWLAFTPHTKYPNQKLFNED